MTSSTPAPTDDAAQRFRDGVERLLKSDPHRCDGAGLAGDLLLIQELQSFLHAASVQRMAALTAPGAAGDPSQLVERRLAENPMIASLTPEQLQVIRDGETLLVAEQLAVAQVGATLKIAPGAASRRVREAVEGVEELPLTVAALADGAIDQQRARILADRSRVLTADLRAELERRLLPEALECTPRQWQNLVDAEVLVLDPEAAERRHRDAVERRRLRVERLEDGVGRFMAELPAHQAQLAWDLFDAVARALKGFDERTVDQRRADAFVTIIEMLASGQTVSVADILSHPHVTRHDACHRPDHPDDLRGNDSDPSENCSGSSSSCSSSARSGVADPSPSQTPQPPPQPTPRPKPESQPTPIPVTSRAPQPPPQPTPRPKPESQPTPTPAAGHAPQQPPAPTPHPKSESQPTPAAGHAPQPRASTPAPEPTTPSESQPGQQLLPPSDREAPSAPDIAGAELRPESKGPAAGVEQPESGSVETAGFEDVPGRRNVDHSSPAGAVDPAARAAEDADIDPTRTVDAEPDPTAAKGTVGPAVAARSQGAAPPCTVGGCGCGRWTLPTRQGRGTHATVVITLEALAGFAQDPGRLSGHGVVTAEYARVLADAATSVNFLVVDEAGRPLAIGDRRRYRPRQRLRDQIAAAYPTCIFTGCHRPVVDSDLDHRETWNQDHPEDGGATDLANLQPLCRHHHRLKTLAGWSYRPADAGTFGRPGRPAVDGRPAVARLVGRPATPAAFVFRSPLGLESVSRVDHVVRPRRGTPPPF